MKKFLVFGNCQSWPLAKTLMENKEFSSHYSWDIIPPIQNINETHVDEILKKVRNADLFLYQPVASSTHNLKVIVSKLLNKLFTSVQKRRPISGQPFPSLPTRPKEITSKFLLGQLKDEAIAISFPSIYFDGYFPQLQTLKGLVSTLNLVHDYFIVYGYALGLTEKHVLSLIQKNDFYPKELSIDLAANSINNLKIREIEYQIDIKLSTFIEENYKRKKLFNQFNHPKREIFRYIAQSILTRIGIEDPKIDEQGESHLDMIMTPIYRSTYNNLNLMFDEDFRMYTAKGNLKLTQEEVVYNFFNFYRNINPADLKKIVVKNKPFIPEVMESQI